MANRKTYRSGSAIGINVVLPNRKNIHVAFTTLSNGSSVFTTDNGDLQKALESHYRFGSLFRLVKEEKPVSSSGNDTKEEIADEGQSVVKVTVTDLASAKDYLSDRFGILRTQLSSKARILEQAKAHGIEFEGI